MTKRKKSKYFLGATAVVTFALTTFLVIPGAANKAFAKDNVNGKTEVELGVTVETIDTVSYDVPLYYVLCVVKNTETGNTEVATPSENGYYVKNISQQRKVAVIGLSVSSVDNASWSLTGQIDHTDRTTKALHMTVGGVQLPSLAPGNNNDLSAEIVPQPGQQGNVFYHDGGYELIEKDQSLTIPVQAEVSKAYEVSAAKEGKVTAQFRLKYQVSPMDEAGNILKAEYAGPAPTP